MFIGITGKARSGKDTFAQLLADSLFDTLRQRFVLTAYAHELKLKVQRDFDLSYEQLWGEDKELEDKRYFKRDVDNEYWSAREILQAYGEFFRSIKYNFWVDALFNAMLEREYKNVIITDVRHPNEADPILAQGGYMIKVTSEREGLPSIHGAQHISETAMDDYARIDFHVTNDKSVEDLRGTAAQVAKFLIDTENMKLKLEAQNGK